MLDELESTMLGQLIDKRYKIAKVIDRINTNGLGQTYLANDTRRPGQPACVVKEIYLGNQDTAKQQHLFTLFRDKAGILDELSQTEKIPKLLAYFLEKKKLYLVEDFIAGEPLSKELISGRSWTEKQVVDLLQETLGLLAEVHKHCIIHGKIKPANFIRQATNKKLVLIGIGFEQQIKNNGDNELSEPAIPVDIGNEDDFDVLDETTLYQAYEQLQGSFHYSTDIYALGMIAVQALTGLSLSELLILRDVNSPRQVSIFWQHRTKVSSKLANIIDKMINNDWKLRYLSVQEVLTDLREILSPLIKNQAAQDIPTLDTVFAHSTFAENMQIDNDDNEDLEDQELLNSFSGKTQATAKKKRGWHWGFLLLFPLLLGGVAATYIWYQYLPSQAKLLAKHGESLLKQGDQQKAMGYFNKALQLNPKAAETYYQRANSHYKQGALQLAIADYNNAIKVNPDYIDALYNRGLVNYELGKMPQAIADFSQIISSQPSDADAYYQRGLAYYDSKKYQEAIADYNTVIKLSPDLASAYINRGLVKMTIGDRSGSLADYTEAIKLDPADAQTYYERGRVRFYLADYQGAVEDYSQAVKLKPDDVDSYINRCSAYINLSNYQAAVNDCSKAIEINSLDVAAYNNRCIAYLNLNNYQLASEDCSIAIGMNPKDSKSYSNRGLARSNSGNKSGAIADLSQAIRLNPNDAVAYTNRGKIYSEQKEYNLALIDFAQAIRLAPQNPQAYYNRGNVLRILKDKTGAIADWEKAASLFLEQGRASDYQNTKNLINQLN